LKTSSPQLERRRALRRQKRQELLGNIWRTVAFLLLSGSLGWLLLRFGWMLEGTSQVVVLGNSGLAPERVADAGEFSFPKPLLEINPAQLERQLKRDLPVESVRVRRLIVPARLEVQMQTRNPVAKATRRIPGGIALGLVDAEGHWIEPDPSVSLPSPTTNVVIEGWSRSRQDVIATLLSDQSLLDNNLERIVLRSDGAILLRCGNLGDIDLGRNSALLDRQILAIDQLSRNLPKALISEEDALIDLSNPDRPEIQLPAKATS
tara:strand:+ start:176 stop:964 length:789 start_codon:yes stop_codon:yes gene_type:complete